MLQMSIEDQAALEQHLHQAATLLKRSTESEKLQDFESIEVEVRSQILTMVSPLDCRNFFGSNPTSTQPQRIIRSLIGEITISHKQARNLGLKRKTPVSPGLEKCALGACAKSSYEKAAEDIAQMMGIKVGHSTPH